MPITNSGAEDKSGKLNKERRQYLRLDTVFPVQFCLVSLDGKNNLSGWLQGFTNDLAKGGICLCVNNFSAHLAQSLKEHKARVSLVIDLPFLGKPIAAQSVAVWMKEEAGAQGKYYIGLAYEKIDGNANSKLMRYAWGKKLFAPIVLGIIVLLGIGLALNSYVNTQLADKNRSLVRQLAAAIQESSVAKQNIREAGREKEELGLKMQALESRIQEVELERLKLQGETRDEISEKSQKINELNTLLKQLSQEKERLKAQLVSVRLKEVAISEDLARIDRKRAVLEKDNFDKMYQWVKVHQNPATGLLMSFEGDSDISGWAFTYDQSLAAQAFINFGDLERARQILEFFDSKADKKGGLYLNAYYASDGGPAEHITHSGPNIWLGIAALQYTHKTKDTRYLGMAEDIAAGIINIQKQDPEGGIRGGPDVSWFATEHNLDAYAFFNMLYTLTNKQKYLASRDKALDWLLKHTYDRKDIPVKRGKGDSTIATDTYAWSIAAIGPEKLKELGMDPDKIMDFAENTCAVNVEYLRPEGRKIEIKGFDFAPQRNVARQGIVSSEWTSQMVISFKIMADYYLKKGLLIQGNNYQLKADEYLASLVKMIICSPSPSGQGANCLPYATQDFVDTGHGWLTPKGKSTGSVSGTTYTIFAYYNYNPLEFQD